MYAGFISGFHSRRSKHKHVHVAANFKGSRGANTTPRGEGGGTKAPPGPPEINHIMHVHVPIEAWMLSLYNTYYECMQTNLLLVHIAYMYNVTQYVYV